MAPHAEDVITVDGITPAATLNESPTATKVWEALPTQAGAGIWGDEIAFVSSPLRR
ncbi:MAG: hypothetical protein MUQ30_06285 [Anaerolineae bacterium]|nr:hypothetical protein [Anaerolineae bacterium]